MPAPPPPPGFVIDTPSASSALGGRPVIRKGAEPVKPDLPTGYGIDPKTGQAAPVPGLPAGFTTPEIYRPMSREEKVAAGLNPDKPFQVSSKGQITQIGGDDKDTADPAKADPDRAFQADTVLQAIGNIRKLAQQPLTLGAGSEYLRYVPIIGQNAADMSAALDQVKGDILRNVLAQSKQSSPNGASGFGNLSNVEGEALKASIAHMQQSQSAGEFIKGLDQAEQYYRRSLARSQGLDPAEAAVAHRLGITPLGTDVAPRSSDNGITRSNELPVVVSPEVAASGTEKAAVNPKIAAVAPQLTQYMNADPKKVTNAMIVGFLRRNGIGPGEWPELPGYLKQRDGKTRFVVDPTYNKPLDAEGVIPGTSFLSEKDRAQAAVSPIGALISGAADTGSFGAMPDVAGLFDAAMGGSFSQGRENFQNKQDLQAYAQPGATVAGNIGGGLSTMLAAAPESFLGLVGNAAKQGGLYGFLSSPDASVGGRVKNAITDATVNAAAAATLDPALRGVGVGGRKIANTLKRMTGTSAEDIANANALTSFATHAPTQSAPDMRARFEEQTKLDATPTGLTALDRSGQDYLARQAATSPAARQTAEEAAAAAQARLPQQLSADFNQAIDDAVGPNKSVADFLRRPAREITGDIQDMAGREYEKGIAPIKHEKLTITPDVIDALDHERVLGAIRDSLANHRLDPETRNELRGLIPNLKTLGSAPEIARNAYAKGIPLSVDAARNIATALDRTAGRLADGSEGGVEMRRLAKGIRSKIAEQYPEYEPVNARYAARMRAITALEDARNHFLGDTTGRAADNLAKASARMNDAPGEPEFQAEMSGAQPLPSERQMAIAGAREATVAKAANGNAGTTADRLTSPGQQERTRMILGERAKALEARASAQASNVRATERLSTGGNADETGGKVAAGMKAVANLGFHRGGAAIASALSGIRGLSAEDAARVVKLYTDPNKAADVVTALEKAYGRRKARFIIARIGAITTTAQKTKPLPAEATGAEK